MQWSEKPSKQTALTCPKKLKKYNTRDFKAVQTHLLNNDETQLVKAVSKY